MSRCSDKRRIVMRQSEMNFILLISNCVYMLVKVAHTHTHTGSSCDVADLGWKEINKEMMVRNHCGPHAPLVAKKSPPRKWFCDWYPWYARLRFPLHWQTSNHRLERINRQSVSSLSFLHEKVCKRFAFVHFWSKVTEGKKIGRSDGSLLQHKGQAL